MAEQTVEDVISNVRQHAGDDGCYHSNASVALLVAEIAGAVRPASALLIGESDVSDNTASPHRILEMDRRLPEMARARADCQQISLVPRLGLSADRQLVRHGD